MMDPERWIGTILNPYLPSESYDPHRPLIVNQGMQMSRNSQVCLSPR